MSKEKVDEDPAAKKGRASVISRDIFRRTLVEHEHDHATQTNYMCQFEDILKQVTTLFIIPRLHEGGVGELGSGDCAIVSYDVLNEAGLRLFILSQCSSTTSGFKRSSRDPLLYILSNSGGNELMTVDGQLALCFGYMCGKGVTIYVGGTAVGSVSKHFSSIYMVKDDRGIKTYILNQGVATKGRPVAVEYLYDDLIAADISSESSNTVQGREKKVVYSIHFNKKASPCPEAKALIIGVAVVLFHDKYRKVTA